VLAGLSDRQWTDALRRRPCTRRRGALHPGDCGPTSRMPGKVGHDEWRPSPRGGNHAPSWARPSALGRGPEAPLRRHRRRVPARPDSLKFAAIGDNGTGPRPVRHPASRCRRRARFPFELVIMLATTCTGVRARGLRHEVHAAVCGAAVGRRRLLRRARQSRQPANTRYEGSTWAGRATTHSPGERALLRPGQHLMDPAQTGLARQRVEAIAGRLEDLLTHHRSIPTPAGTGPISVEGRARAAVLENGINIVLSGHDHVYERLQPQKGSPTSCRARALAREG